MMKTYEIFTEKYSVIVQANSIAYVPKLCVFNLDNVIAIVEHERGMEFIAAGYNPCKLTKKAE